MKLSVVADGPATVSFNYGETITMKVMVPFKNPRGGESTTVKLGFSWTLFLFSSFLGIPLFLRRLYPYAFLFLALWVVTLVGPELFGAGRDQAVMMLALYGIGIGLNIWMGVKGNEYTAKHLLDQGWAFAEPHSEFTQAAAQAWGVTAPSGEGATRVSPHDQRLGA